MGSIKKIFFSHKPHLLLTRNGSDLLSETLDTALHVICISKDLKTGETGIGVPVVLSHVRAWVDINEVLISWVEYLQDFAAFFFKKHKNGPRIQPWNLFCCFYNMP